jgi:Cu-Zn family superoxide dismutase
MNLRPLPVLVSVALLGPLAGEAAAADERVRAELKFADGKDAGTISLIGTSAGVLLKLDLKGLTPGPHALHLHEVGKCDGDFSSAGAIYNPLHAKHGFLSAEGPMAGDLPNAVAASDGTVKAELLSTFLNLSRDTEDTLFDEDGAAFVLFAGPDDYLSAPEGGASARIACGVIEAE